MKETHQQISKTFTDAMSVLVSKQRELICNMIDALVSTKVVEVADGFNPYALELSVTFNCDSAHESKGVSMEYNIGLGDVDEDSRPILKAAIKATINRNIDPEVDESVNVNFEDWS